MLIFILISVSFRSVSALYSSVSTPFYQRFYSSSTTPIAAAVPATAPDTVSTPVAATATSGIHSGSTLKSSTMLRDEAYRQCIKFIDSWSGLEKDDFEFADINGGLTNKLYRCSVSKSSGIDSPSSVLIRILSEIGDADLFTHELSQVVFCLLSERKFGPHLWGIFPGGRIEDFYDHSKTLTPCDLRTALVSAELARHVSTFHSFNMPLPKRPLLLQQLCMWLKSVQNTQFRDSADQDRLNEYLHGDGCVAFHVAELVELLKQTPSPCVFCHNDLHSGNVLVDHNTEESDKPFLRLIDYDYTAYNYQAFDFGNHFCEWSIRYSDSMQHGFEIDLSLYPNREQQMNFFRAYCEDLPSLGGRKPDDTYLEDMFIASNRFALASHLLWSLWGILQASNNVGISFGYLEYAFARLDHYKRMRKWLDTRDPVDWLPLKY